MLLFSLAPDGRRGAGLVVRKCKMYARWMEIMGLRESWNGLGTGGKLLVGLAVGVGLLFVGMIVLTVGAAVIASFVLGIGGDPGTAAPQASFSFEYDSAGTEVTIMHESGNPLNADSLFVEVGDRRVPWTAADGEIVAGDTVTVDVSSGDTLQIAYKGQESVTILDSDTVPA